MKYLLLVSFLTLTGCSSLSVCGEKQYSFEIPSTIPFLNGEFKVKRSSDHVDCNRPPEERVVK